MRKSLFIVLLYIFLAEVVLGGPGFWGVSEIGVSFRKLLFFLVVLVGYIQFIEKKRFLIYGRDKLVLLGVFTTFVLWIFAIPLIYGQGVSFAFQDGGSILVLLLYFPIAQLLRKGLINWTTLKDYFINLITVVALLQIVIWLNNLFDLGISFDMINFFGAADYGSIMVGPMPDGFYRVMWISTVLMIPGIFLVIGKKKNNLVDYIKVFCCVFSLYVSYTRALWLASAIGGLIIICLKERVKVRDILIFAVIAVVVIGWAILANNTDNIFLRLYSLSDDDGTFERLIQIDSILKMWEQNLLFGIGFGGHADYIRVAETPYAYEVSLISLLMKLGVIGISLWIYILSYLFYIAKRSSTDTSSKKKWLNTLAGTVAFLFCTSTNPYLLNFVGMTVILVMLIELEQVRLEN